MAKNQPAKQEAWVQSPGWEDLLEKAMPTHSSILAWRSPQTEEHGSYSAWDRRVRHERVAFTFKAIFNHLTILLFKNSRGDNNAVICFCSSVLLRHTDGPTDVAPFQG